MLSPIATLLRRSMTARGLERPTDLHAALADSGVAVSLQTVLNWLKGGSVDPSRAEMLARFLGVSTEAVVLAAAGFGERDAAAGPVGDGPSTGAP